MPASQQADIPFSDRDYVEIPHPIQVIVDIFVIHNYAEKPLRHQYRQRGSA